MDGKRPINTGHRRQSNSNFIADSNSPSTLTPDPALTANFNTTAATIGQLDPSFDDLFSQLTHLESAPIPPFYNLVHQTPMSSGSTTTPPTPSPWNTIMPQPFYPQSSLAGSSQYPSMNVGAIHHPGHSDMTPGTSSQQSPPQGALYMMERPSLPPEVELEVAEDKRRRNTAASARFRIKKKHKTIALERSVTDLTGRAQDLERQVADLRKENHWLKEIVMMKGGQFAASNPSHQEALRQAANHVIGGQVGTSSTSISGSKEQSENESDDGTEVDAEDDNQEKGGHER